MNESNIERRLAERGPDSQLVRRSSMSWYGVWCMVWDWAEMEIMWEAELVPGIIQETGPSVQLFCSVSSARHEFYCIVH